MKKNIYVFFAISVICIMLGTKNVMAYEYYTVNANILTDEPLESLQKEMKDISNEYYESNDQQEATINVTVTQVKDANGQTNYFIGNQQKKMQWLLSEEFLFADFIDDEQNKWDIWIDIQYTISEYSTDTELKHDVYVQMTYLDNTGDFNPEKDGWKIVRVKDAVEDAVNVVRDTLKSETVKRFAKNPYGFGLTYIYNGLRYVFGDLPLTFAHAITFSDTKFMYSYNKLSTDEYASKDKYTNVSKYQEQKTKSWQKEINIKNENSYEDEEYRRFSSSTEIPVVTTDLYNIATDNIEFFDTNFFQVDKERHQEESPTMWLNLRDFTMSMSHVITYLAVAILIIILIINGIQIVRHTFDNPEAKAEHIRSLRRFAMSLILLVGTILIMTLCTYGSKLFLNMVKVEDREELPIRINVEESGYSFSTNITGYFRYMSGIEGIHNYREKGMYTIAYIIIAWVDVIATALMTLRTFELMLLTILGPLLAVLYSLNTQGAMRYAAWVRTYVGLSFIQIIFAIIYRVIFKFLI